MRFYIAGGWGYKNLGDYAILIALLKRIEKLPFPTDITVASFDPDETRHVLDGAGADVVPSFHRLLWKGQPYRELQVSGKTWVVHKPDSGLAVKMLERAQSRIYSSYGSWLNRRNERYLDALDALPNRAVITESDCFVLAGGGYINEWQSCFLSHVLELECARKSHVPVLALGPTLGPFASSQRRFVKRSLETAKALVVRDVESVSELNKLGLEADLMPDLALSDIPDAGGEPVPSIILVPGDVPQACWKVLLTAVESFCAKNKFSVRLVVTRLYAMDVFVAERMKDLLKGMGVRVELTITDDYSRMLPQLMTGRVIVSWNLHGLILAWRAGIPGVCLNDGRKFVSFMEQTGQCDRLVPWRTLSYKGVQTALESARSEHPISLDSRRAFAKKVSMKIDNTLAMLNSGASK